jgi:hypothetical protein
MVLATGGEETLHLLMKGNTFKQMFLRIGFIAEGLRYHKESIIR